MFKFLCCIEGIILVLELFYVLVYVMKIVLILFKDYIFVMNMCGCGDKDIFIVVCYFGVDIVGKEGCDSD